MPAEVVQVAEVVPRGIRAPVLRKLSDSRILRGCAGCRLRLCGSRRMCPAASVSVLRKLSDSRIFRGVCRISAEVVQVAEVVSGGIHAPVLRKLGDSRILRGVRRISAEVLWIAEVVPGGIRLRVAQAQ